MRKWALYRSKDISTDKNDSLSHESLGISGKCQTEISADDTSQHSEQHGQLACTVMNTRKCDGITAVTVGTQISLCVLLTVSMSTATSHKEHSVYTFCTLWCAQSFRNCLKYDCHRKRWPRPVTVKCTKERSDCLDRCVPYKINTP